MAEDQFTIAELEAEEWRFIADFGELFSVSSLGRVRRNVTHGGKASGRILSSRMWGTHTARYALLTRKGATKRLRLDNLVAKTFLGERQRNQVLGFKDGNSTNVSADNLEYVSKEAAIVRRFPKQTCRTCKSEQVPSHFVELRRYNECQACRSGETVKRRAAEMQVLMAQRPHGVDIETYIHRQGQRKKRRKVRDAVLKVYGGSCQCCGEAQQEFLAIDHIEGGGAEHRRRIKSVNIYPWLIKNGFPEGFQVLCHNCNMAKGFYGACPHAIAHRGLFRVA